MQKLVGLNRLDNDEIAEAHGHTPKKIARKSDLKYCDEITLGYK